MKGSVKPSMGLMVDFAERKVSFAGYVAHIEEVDGMTVFFGSNEDKATGEINGDSGLMSATTVSGDVHSSYELFCKRVTPSKSQNAK